MRWDGMGMKLRNATRPLTHCLPLLLLLQTGARGLSLLIWHKKMLYDDEPDAHHDKQHTQMMEKFSKLRMGLRSMFASKK
jgi:hypothetical protein